jgi:hypothetical protein
MQDIDQHIDTKEFNQSFWEWFDNLPEIKRNQFNYYKSDLAKINFYNTQWRYRLHGSNG